MLVSLILLTLCLSLFVFIYYKLRSGQKNIKKESLVNTYDSLIRLLKERKQLNIEEIKLTSVLLKSRADRSRTTYGLFEIENHTSLKISCEDGFIAPEIVQPEGKRRMPVQDFLNGLRNS